MYLDHFSFPDLDDDWYFMYSIKETCHDTTYPFGVMTKLGLTRLDFDKTTILCGGNGSGKTTVLNVIAEKLEAKRDSIYNKSNFFPDYVRKCNYKYTRNIPQQMRIITSDDVFDFMLNIRNINEGIDTRRDELFREYKDMRDGKNAEQHRMRSLDDYDKLVRVNKAHRLTKSQFVRSELQQNVREQSNGESAFMYFTDKIGDDGLFLLDEPENSLSPKLQLELKKFIEDSARYFGCQFVISTHSPFLLSMNNAKIYDLDADPVCIKHWTELENVRTYYDFFISHTDEFK